MAKLSFMDGLDEEVAVVERVSIVKEPPKGAIDASEVESRKELRVAEERLHSIEQELFEESMEVSVDMLAFRDVDPGDEEVPPEWIEKYGQERAMRRFKVARAAWMNAKEAPIALKHATQLAVGIMRVRSLNNGAPRSLNIQLVQLVEHPQTGFRELEVDK